MSGKNTNGVRGLLKAANDLSRTANSVSRTKNTVERMVGGNKKNANTKKETKNAALDPLAWKCVCGTSNTAKFCGNCGKAAPKEISCTNCGWKRTLENSTMKFCGECGTKFEE